MPVYIQTCSPAQYVLIANTPYIDSGSNQYWDAPYCCYTLPPKSGPPRPIPPLQIKYYESNGKKSFLVSFEFSFLGANIANVVLIRADF